MTHIIHAREEIIKSAWIHPRVKDFLIESSMAVNRRNTLFDEEEFIRLLVEYQPEPIRQIAIAYEAPPIFTRNMYAPPREYDFFAWFKRYDIYTPGLFGLARHDDGSLGIILFFRKNLYRLLLDKKHRFLRAAFDQERRIRRFLGEKSAQLGPLALVGILPGYVLKRKEQFPEYPEYIDMCEAKNQNSARFVIEATRKTLEEEGMTSHDLIVLGSHGSLGRVIMEHFPGALGIDLGNLHDIPTSGTYLFLDCTVGNTLEKYIRSHLIHTDIHGVWLNEAYPPPTPQVVERVRPFMTVKHIVGVTGDVVPSFPGEYNLRIPCCMGLLDQPSETVQVRVI